MSEDGTPRLYLIARADTPVERLEAALGAGDVACLLLRDATADSASLVTTAQGHGTAVLVADDARLAGRLDADGVHLGPGGDVARIRNALPDDRIVGASCGDSRHDAMLAGEAGADYVAFSGRDGDPSVAADPAILDWWQTMMTLPCVAMGRIALADVHGLARAGADFVALEDAVWTHPDGAAAAVAEAMRQLSGVTRA